MRAINHVDGRRRLHPAAYFRPNAFGNVPDATLRIPPEGDVSSARIAAQQHRLVYAYRHTKGCPSGAELGRRFGFSRQVFSVSMAGDRWLGEAVMSALLAALQEAKRA